MGLLDNSMNAITLLEVQGCGRSRLPKIERDRYTGEGPFCDSCKPQVGWSGLPAPVELIEMTSARLEVVGRNGPVKAKISGWVAICGGDWCIYHRSNATNNGLPPKSKSSKKS